MRRLGEGARGEGEEQEEGWEKQSWLFNCHSLTCPCQWVCAKPAERICPGIWGGGQVCVSVP